MNFLLAAAFGFSLIFWILWVTLNLAYGLRTTHWGWNLVFYALLLPGALIDVMFNVLIATILFLALPPKLTLSQRLTLYISCGPNGLAGLTKMQQYRSKLAVYVATTLIEPWAPGHIGLVKYGWPPVRITFNWIKKRFPEYTGNHL